MPKEKFETEKEWKARLKAEGFVLVTSDLAAIKKKAIEDVRPEVEKMLRDAHRETSRK